MAKKNNALKDGVILKIVGGMVAIGVALILAWLSYTLDWFGSDSNAEQTEQEHGATENHATSR